MHDLVKLKGVDSSNVWVDIRSVIAIKPNGQDTEMVFSSGGAMMVRESVERILNEISALKSKSGTSEGQLSVGTR